MYCNKCNEPLKNNIQVCPYCGATQPKSDNQPVQVDFSQFQPTPNQTVTIQKTDDMPTWYYTDSKLLLIIFLFIGLVKIVSGVSTGSAFTIYRGIVACAAGLIFIPNVKVGIQNPTGILAIKIVAAVAVILII